MKQTGIIYLVIFFIISFSGRAQENGTDPSLQAGSPKKPHVVTCVCGDGTQTPLGVMTDHIHPKGEWMVSYTYMNMAMKGNYMGDTRVSDDFIYKFKTDLPYMMAPETMTMQMHMGMVMYGLTDNLTLMVMGGYETFRMTMNIPPDMVGMPHMNMDSGSTSMVSSSAGFTDTKIYGLYSFLNKGSNRLVASLGLNLPTGAIRAKGKTMLGDNAQMPYDMQPGTGSFGLAPDLTYIHQFDLLALGADLGADIKLNKNTIGYKLGNVYHITAWANYKFLSFVSGSVRGEGILTGNITGSDPELADPYFPTSDPTTVTENYGGKVVNLYAGLNFHVKQPVLKNFTLLVEYGMPVYQNLNGIQMASKFNLSLGLQYKI